MESTADKPTGENLGAMLEELRRALSGELRHDALSRALYATDASIYEIVPDAIVLPRSVEDVVATVRICAEHNVPITARGAGTGLTGGAVNRGIQLDCSRHLNRIVHVDPDGRTARVEPGVVLDELNAELTPHGLQFGPDVATGNRATIGGMIANNSCGAHSIVHGRTVDHVLSLDVVLADGSICTWGPGADSTDNPLARGCQEVLSAVSAEYADEIAARFPKVMRRNGGYALDRLRLDNGRVNAETIVCGSEGTLCVVVGATLRLTDVPRNKGMVVAHFEGIPPALEATPAVLKHGAAAVELVDKLILDATLANPAMARRRTFLDGDPEAILICELFDDDESRLRRRLDELAADLKSRSLGYAHPIITDPAGQADVWEVRKSGLGLLMSRPGDRQPQAFVEDTSVDPAKLRDYIDRFGRILDDEGIRQVGCYAHASVGCLHVRPALNLKDGDDLERMRRIADRVSSLALEFGGTMTGEHGDGIIRSCWLEKMYGPRIMEAFGRVKRAFDPQGLFNPGKIVSPLPMTENLRYGPQFESQDPPTHLDFSEHGGMAGLAGMCSGVGQCRQRLVGTMCPSFMATGDEQHTTRARANALRIALSNRDLLHDLSDPALIDVMDLCLSCKACKTECPTGTDLAKLKAEWLAYRNRTFGVPKRSRLVAASPDLAVWGSRFAPLSNWVMQSKPVRALMERRYGLDRRVPPPRFARTTFRKWFAKRRKKRAQPPPAERPRVIYFVDTWTNFHVPQVGRAAVKVLEALGYHVIVPLTKCCGRPLLSKGMLPEARLLAQHNVQTLAGFAARGIPIVGTEPSCVSAMLDEWPQLVRTIDAYRVADMTLNIESFVARALSREPNALRFKPGRRPLLYHGHCHQKALTGTEDALAVLSACTGGGASEIDSGCCGMAGSFGHEVEHYDVAKAIGEQRLFPAIRDRGEADVAASGFSCRHQIEHHTGVHPRHVIECVADALA
ncbi:MAG TPA: FAD-linked oxidase C-terminal domain-containing protein [Phycisphaerae bacterium]|nr:FAD-linked oxidase C-terminal domain-containing protein [Phycisphaerae bacterium]